MSQSKFIGLEDAAAQLEVSKEVLNELREAGKLRAYRDGASWKFRTEDIDNLDPSDLAGGGGSGFGSGLDLDDMTLEASGLSSLSLEPDEGTDQAGAADVEELSLDDDEDEGTVGLGETSDLDLEDLDEPTVASDPDLEAGAHADATVSATDDDSIDLLDEDDNESILLSEEEIGDSPDRPASTIIGRSQLRNEPSDDDLVLASTEDSNELPAAMSDVRLADEDIDEIVLGPAKADDAARFEDLEELEIDLEAESSRILEAEDLEAARAAANELAAKEATGGASGPGPESSLSLDLGDDSGSNAAATGEHAPVSAGGSGSFQLAGDSDEPLELELTDASGVGGDAALSDDQMDDMVLDSSDEDEFTLSSADSGINLQPSDSGLALDDDSFSLGGSVVGSALDLGSSLSGSDLGAISASNMSAIEGSTAFASSPDFNLQPAEEEEGDDEEDSSQIIALDAIEEGEEDEEGVSISPSAMAMSPHGAGMAQGHVIIGQEAVFPVWIVALLGCSVMIMAVTGVMATDLLRSMWAWEEPYSIDSSLIEMFLGLIGMGN